MKECRLAKVVFEGRIVSLGHLSLERARNLKNRWKLCCKAVYVEVQVGNFSRISKLGSEGSAVRVRTGMSDTKSSCDRYFSCKIVLDFLKQDQVHFLMCRYLRETSDHCHKVLQRMCPHFSELFAGQHSSLRVATKREDTQWSLQRWRDERLAGRRLLQL